MLQQQRLVLYDLFLVKNEALPKRNSDTTLARWVRTYGLIAVKIIRSCAADNGEQNVNKYGVMRDLHTVIYCAITNTRARTSKTKENIQ